MKKTEKIRLPKLHLCAGNDDFRIIMNYILVTPEECVATDGNMLIAWKSEYLFPYYYDKLPRCLIHAKNWIHLTKTHLSNELVDSGIKIVFGENEIIIPFKYESDYYEYPKYKEIFEYKPENINILGLNADLYKKLSMAIGKSNLYLKVNDNYNALHVSHDDKQDEYRAILMPLRVTF